MKIAYELHACRQLHAISLYRKAQEKTAHERPSAKILSYRHCDVTRKHMHKKETKGEFQCKRILLTWNAWEDDGWSNFARSKLKETKSWFWPNTVNRWASSGPFRGCTWRVQEVGERSRSGIERGLQPNTQFWISISRLLPYLFQTFSRLKDFLMPYLRQIQAQ